MTPKQCNKCGKIHELSYHRGFKYCSYYNTKKAEECLKHKKKLNKPTKLPSYNKFCPKPQRK